MAKKKLVSTGVGRLDELLGGGIPSSNQVLLLGAPYTGRTTLQAVFVSQALKSGMPCIVVTYNRSAGDVRKSIHAINKKLQGYEKKGYIRYVDVYSLGAGLKGKNPNAKYLKVDHLKDQLTTISTMQKGYHSHKKPSCMVVDSVSGLISKTGASKAVKFLDMVNARSKAYKTTSLFTMTEGVHGQGEVSQLENLMDFTMDFKTEKNGNYLRVRGLDSVKSSNWVLYKQSKSSFELTGPFNVQYIS